MTAELAAVPPDAAAASALLAAAEHFGTPLYLLDERSVTRAAQEVEAAFSPRFLLHYSFKANDLPAVGRLLGCRGWGANVVSRGEWLQADAAGFGESGITFEGVGKSDSELQDVVSSTAAGRPLRWLVLESADEAAALISLAEAVGLGKEGQHPLDVLLRLNPEVVPETTEGLAVGAPSSKFGMTRKEAHELGRVLEATRVLRLRGIHVHVGSQLDSTRAWCEAGVSAVGLADELRPMHPHVDTVDFGGGFPAGEDGRPRPADFRTALDAALAQHGLSLPVRAAIEPGRFLVANAAWLVARVLHVRPGRGGLPMAVIDAGMTELIRPALYGAVHPVLSLGEPRGPAVRTAVEGPVCESTDSLGFHPLPPLSRGDVVVIADVGAYGASFTSRYNGRPAPLELVLDGEGRVEVETRVPLQRSPQGQGVLGVAAADRSGSAMVVDDENRLT